MTRHIVRRIFVLIGLAGVVAAFLSSGNAVSGQASSCGMQLNDTPAIFCDTFDLPSPVTNRSGQLNGTVWGVSRLAGGNVTWKNSILDGCNGPQPASSVGATDVIVCNGQLRQSVEDNTDVTVLAMYPKQPFDFAGRTGTVAFDVSNDTTGPHGAWPEFWITDQPIPTPSTHLIPCDLCTLPRHGLGIRFDANQAACPAGTRAGWRVGSAIAVRNYVPEDRNIFEDNTTGMQVREAGCASLSSGPNGGLNHIELRISQDNIDIYASDAGSRTLRLINTIRNANLSFTRGLIWIGDYHYNAEKEFHPGDPLFPNQRNHTYTWDNVAFDGPATYRDLSFDVLDGTTALGGGLYKIGWDTTPTNPANLTTLPMTSQNIAAASSAFLLFNFGHFATQPSTFNYRINGHANSFAAPPPSSPLPGKRSLAVPVPLNQLVGGPQNILLSSDVDLGVHNVNIVLVAAAPVPGAAIPAVPANLRLISQ